MRRWAVVDGHAVDYDYPIALTNRIAAPPRLSAADDHEASDLAFILADYVARWGDFDGAVEVLDSAAPAQMTPPARRPPMALLIVREGSHGRCDHCFRRAGVALLAQLGRVDARSRQRVRQT